MIQGTHSELHLTTRRVGNALRAAGFSERILQQVRRDVVVIALASANSAVLCFLPLLFV